MTNTRFLTTMASLLCIASANLCWAQSFGGNTTQSTYPPTLNGGSTGGSLVRLAPLNQPTAPSLGNGTLTSDGGLPLRGRVSAIPKGSMMMVRLDQSISSYSSNLGDPVTATLENDLFINDAVAIPAGSTIQGQVANVSHSGHLGKAGDMDLRFFSAKTPDGVIVPFRAHVVTTDDTGIMRGDRPYKVAAKDVGYAAGGAAVGTVSGVAAGGLLGAAGTGALFGLGVGSLAGIGYAVVHKGKEVVLPSGSRLSLVADQTATTSP